MRFMLKLEAGGDWHRFAVEAENGHEVATIALDFGVPYEAHYGMRLARPDEKLPTLTKDEVLRLAEKCWSKHGLPITT